MFSIENQAGGDVRWFRWDSARGLPANATKHADNIGYGGPKFGGAKGEEAEKAFDEYQEFRDDL
jgi:hypothetical protein